MRTGERWASWNEEVLQVGSAIYYLYCIARSSFNHEVDNGSAFGWCVGIVPLPASSSKVFICGWYQVVPVSVTLNLFRYQRCSGAKVGKSDATVKEE